MWPFQRKAVKPEAPDVPEGLERRVRDVEEALEHLSADMDWLKADQAKLRGRLTGGLRRTAEDAAGAQQPTGEPPRFSPEWWKAQGVVRGVR